ncbi:DUF397 domain-containing protein [Streptomyces sp. NPDC093261]|uniref:DUF397 domain-containing protein n=1 Tax=Streptomyces sp. NPDC093261 TaxID=3366037 RepID=UPI0037F9FFBA
MTVRVRRPAVRPAPSGGLAGGLRTAYPYRCGDCVEVALGPTTIHIRDSKNSTGPRLALSRAAWSGFVGFAAHRRHPLS